VDWNTLKWEQAEFEEKRANAKRVKKSPAKAGGQSTETHGTHTSGHAQIILTDKVSPIMPTTSGGP